MLFAQHAALPSLMLIMTSYLKDFWPGSASRRPVYLFQQDLFRFFMLLRQQNPGVSYSGFLRTLEEFSRQKG